MTEFQELTQDAPNFVSMGRGELVAYAYGMFAAGTKANAENAKLRELLQDMWREGAFEAGACYVDTERLEERTRELGVEVDVDG